MKKLLKIFIITLILIGMGLSVINFISIDGMAIIPDPDTNSEKVGTKTSDGECYGRPSNC